MTNRNEGAAQEPGKKKGSFFSRMLTLALVLCVVLAAVVLTTMEDGRHFASLRRWLMYGGGGAAEDIYAYAADPSNRYGKLGDSLLVVNPNTAQLISNDGSILYEVSINQATPQLSVGKRQAAVCDVGGGTLYLLSQEGVRRVFHTEQDLRYYSARLNSRDDLAVTEQKSGYKGSVSVYNSDLELVFSYDSYDNYISDAAVAEDGRSVVVVSLESDSGIYASRLLIYNLSNGQLESSTPVSDGLVLDLAWGGGRILSLCDKRFTITTVEGETLLDQPYGNLYLQDYAFGGKDFCALLLGRYQAGNICTLSTYNMEGERIGSLELTEEVLDISAAGNCLAVLHGDSLVVYDRELKELARTEDIDYAGQVRVEEDGSVLLISGTSAWKFLP